MTARAALLVVVLVLASGCGVRPMDARVAGVGPDTHPAALARASEEAAAEEAQAMDRQPPQVASPDEVRGDLGPITVGLRGEAGVALVERPAVLRSGEPVLDAILTLREPLTEDELAAGLWTEVPEDTEVRDVRVRGDSVLIELTGGFAVGGTEAQLWQRTQQVACTALHAIAGDARVVVEVRLDGEFVGRFDRFGDERSDADAC